MAAGATELDRRRHRAALDELIVALSETYGPLDSPDDEEAIARYVELLS